MKAIAIVVIIFSLMFTVFLGYCCCVISGKNSRDEESDDELKQICKVNNLEFLENATLEELLKLYVEDGVNFMINDGNIVDYDINK